MNAHVVLHSSFIAVEKKSQFKGHNPVKKNPRCSNFWTHKIMQLSLVAGIVIVSHLRLFRLFELSILKENALYHYVEFLL